MKYLLLFFFSPAFLFGQVPGILWQKRIGSTNGDIARTMNPTSDGGFILGGYSQSDAHYEKTGYCRGGADYWIVKTDSNGNIEWDKTIGGAQTPGQFPSYEHDIMRSISQTSDGGYLVCGDSNSPISGEKTESCKGDDDYWILKLSSDGIIEWQKTLGGDLTDSGANAIITLDGGFLIYGNSISAISGDKTEECRGNTDIWLIKLSATGSLEWQKTIGGSGLDLASKVIQNADATYTIAGNSSSNISGEKSEDSRGYSDIWIIKVDNAGNILQQKTIGGSDMDGATGIIPTADGHFLVTAVSSSPVSGEKTDTCRGEDDYWILKIDSAFNIIWQKTYGGSSSEYLSNILACDGGGYIAYGSSQSGISGEKSSPVLGYTDAWLLKLNDVGDIEWQKTIGGFAPGTYNGQDGFVSATQLTDNGIVFFGTTDSNISGDIVDFPRGSSDYWLIKLGAENLSVHENGFVREIKMFPNPASQFLTIQNGTDSNDIFEYRIIDMIGRVVTFGISNYDGKIDIQNLKNGDYIVEIKPENGGVFKTKLIKK